MGNVLQMVPQEHEREKNLKQVHAYAVPVSVLMKHTPLSLLCLTFSKSLINLYLLKIFHEILLPSEHLR